MSVPNQKVITIHQSTEVPFVKLGINEYQEAFRKMAPCTFAMYLYLAGNREGFSLELSKAAFENATGYTKSSYHRAYKDLVNLGYIYEDNGSLNFATSPKIGTKGVIQDWDSEVSEMNTPIFKNETAKFQNWDETYSEMNTEINNKYKTDKTKKIDNSSPSNDYSYLDEIVCYEDGSYVLDGKIRFIDGNTDPLFYEKPKEYQARRIAEITPFKMGEIEYILSKMED